MLLKNSVATFAGSVMFPHSQPIFEVGVAVTWIQYRVKGARKIGAGGVKETGGGNNTVASGAAATITPTVVPGEPALSFRIDTSNVPSGSASVSTRLSTTEEIVVGMEGVVKESARGPNPTRGSGASGVTPVIASKMLTIVLEASC